MQVARAGEVSIGQQTSAESNLVVPPSGLVTVLFTDIVGSTALIQRLGDDAFEPVRRDHFQMLTDAVVASGGTAVKNLGDGLMAVFGSSVDAMGCAVAIQQSIARYNRRSSGPHFDVRVGIHIGEPVVEGGDYYGTPVVVARRLCDCASGGEILVSKLLTDLVGSRGGFELQALNAVALKGIDGDVPVCRLAWSEQSSLPLPSAVKALREGNFVGRADEAATVRDAWRAAQGSRLQVVLLAGEPGIGKTTLAVRQAEEGWAEGALVLFGRCDEESLLPYQPFVEALTDYVDHASADDLRRHVGGDASDLHLLLPALHRRLPGHERPGSGDETERYRMFEAVADLLSAIGREMPVFLVLDDAHWADRPTLQLLQYVVRRCAEVPLLILVTYRDTDLVRTHPMAETLVDLRRADGVVRVPLRGLSASEVASLVAGGQEPDASDTELAQLVWNETEGSPLFLREILRHLSETGAIKQTEDGRWRARRRLQQLGIPESVRELISRRLGRLPESANSVLVAASVLGREFDVDLLSTLTETSVDGVLDVLDEAAAAGVVSEVGSGPGRYSFTHALVRQALYGELSLTRRVLWHRRTGETIEVLHASDLAAHYGELAHHFTQASASGTADKAVEYCRLAAEADLAGLAYEEAARHLHMALEVAQDAGMAGSVRAPLLLTRGRALWRAGDPAARTVFTEAAELARADGDAESFGRAALGFAGLEVRPVWVQIGVVDEMAVSLLEEALDSIGTEESPLRALLMSTLGRELHWLPGTRERRSQLSEGAVDMARRLDEPLTLANVLTNRCLAMFGADSLEQRQADVAEILAIPEVQKSISLTCTALGHQAMTDMEIGDFADARACWQQCGDRVQKLRDPILLEMLYLSDAALSELDGRLDEADQLRLKGFQYGQEGHDRNSVVVLLGGAVLALRRRGRSAEGIGLAKGLQELYPLLSTTIGVSLMLLAMDAGDELLVRETLSQIDIDDTDMPRGDLVWLFVLAGLTEVAAFLDDPQLAARLRPLLEPYRGRWVTLGYTSCWGSVDGSLALANRTLGKLDEAIRDGRAAVAAAEQAGSPVLLAEAQMLLAETLEALAMPDDEAEVLRSKVGARATDLGMPALAAQSAHAAWPAAPTPTTAQGARRSDKRRARITTGARSLVSKFIKEHDDEHLLRRFSSPLAQRALFSAMAKSFQPTMALGFEGAIEFELLFPGDAGDAPAPEWWAIDIRGPKASARHGRHIGARASVRIALPDLVRLVAGEIHPMGAVIERRIQIDGDPIVAGRIPEMFGGVLGWLDAEDTGP